MAKDKAPMTPEQAARLYGIDRWGAGFFSVGKKGRLMVHPSGEGKPGVAFDEVSSLLEKIGIDAPVIVRFPQILRARAQDMVAAFQRAVDKHAYAGRHRALYPVKANPARVVMERLVGGGLLAGFETGSPAELRAACSVEVPAGSLLIANGFKDEAAIRLALSAQAAGRETFLVCEGACELGIITHLMQALGVIPGLGIRARMGGEGAYARTGFPPEALPGARVTLERAGLLGALRLLHVHPGSQIHTPRRLQRAMVEAARLYVSLRQMGFPLEVVDLGGGLPVDYGHGPAVAAGFDLYADAAVAAFSQVCQQADMPVPDLVTECGRALAAHHAVTIVEAVREERVPRVGKKAAAIPEGAALLGLLQGQDALEVDALWHRAKKIRRRFRRRFLQGSADFSELTRLEAAFASVARRVVESLADGAQKGKLSQIAEEAALFGGDRLLVNFSLFRSLPDAWGLGQVFPVMPFSRLDETPKRRAILRDFTCDPDGRLLRFPGEAGVLLPLPAMGKGGKLPLGLFLCGAYQEALGSAHNLFGRLPEVEVVVDEGGARVDTWRPGDTAGEILADFGFAPRTLQPMTAGLARILSWSMDDCTYVSDD